MKYKVIDLFAGVGGMSLGFSNLNATPIPLDLVGSTTSVIAPDSLTILENSHFGG